MRGSESRLFLKPQVRELMVWGLALSRESWRERVASSGSEKGAFGDGQPHLIHSPADGSVSGGHTDARGISFLAVFRPSAAEFGGRGWLCLEKDDRLPKGRRTPTWGAVASGDLPIEYLYRLMSRPMLVGQTARRWTAPCQGMHLIQGLRPYVLSRAPCSSAATLVSVHRHHGGFRSRSYPGISLEG